MGPIGRPETVVRTYHFSLLYNTEERSAPVQPFSNRDVPFSTLRLYLPLKSDVKFYKITKDTESYIFVYSDGGWKTGFLLMPVTHVVEEASFSLSVT
jgi:hypothetical protein